MIFTRGLRVCLAVQPADLRRGFEGLALLVRGALQEDERSSKIFVFTNKRRDRIRLLYWDGTGLWILTKKLEAGTFAWPKVPEGAAKIALRVEALERLLSGIELKGARLRPWYEDPAAASRAPAACPAAPGRDVPETGHGTAPTTRSTGAQAAGK
jgi:transposase